MSDYDFETVRDAIRAAADVGRYDIAQAIVEEAYSDLCVLCTAAWAEGTAMTPDGIPIQVCSNCARWASL